MTNYKATVPVDPSGLGDSDQNNDIEGRTMKDMVGDVTFTVKVCKHNISMLECDECFGAEALRTAKIIDETKWWRRLLRRIK